MQYYWWTVAIKSVSVVKTVNNAGQIRKIEKRGRERGTRAEHLAIGRKWQAGWWGSVRQASLNQNTSIIGKEGERQREAKA